MMVSRKAAAFVSIAAIIASACSGSTATQSPAASAPASAPATAVATAPATAAAATATAAATPCTVGVSWNNYQEERWAKWDEPAIKAALTAGGATYISNDAKSSAETQITNVENLISQGAKVVILLAQDGTAIKPAVTAALQAGVGVIAYDRLIEDPGALYITFDNVKVGHLQAQYVFAAKPTGNYVVIKGSPTDANANFLRQGMDEVIRSTPAPSRSSARPTPTTGTRQRPRPRWSSSLPLTTTRSTPFSLRTTAWPAALWPRSRPRAWRARFRSPVRTATPPR